MTFLNEANAKCAFDVFHLLSKDCPHENIIFSPLNLSAALSVLFHGLQCDTEAETEKELHLNGKDDVSSENRSHCEAPTSIAQATVSKAGYEVEEVEGGTSSAPTSGEDERKTDSKLVASQGKTVPQLDAEKDAFYFIPWRSHFLRMDEPGNLSEKQLSRGEQLSPTPAGPHTNREEQSGHENMGETNLAMASSSVEVTPEKISALLWEFKQTVKHADNNVQVFKETFDVFKESCDNMCISMSKLQMVLEALISILRE